MLFKRTSSNNARLTLIALALALFMIFTACTGSPTGNTSSADQGNNNVEQNNNGKDLTDNEHDKADKEQDKINTDNENDNTGKETDSGGSSQNSGSEEVSKETAAPDENTPEDILKAYEGQYAEIDQEMIDFEVKDFEGNTVKLSDYKGKIIFLNFWATWCPPCRTEMPHMQTFYDKYKDEDIVILAVNPAIVENQGINDSKKAEDKARKFIEKEGYTFPVLLDQDDSAWAIYQQRGIPANYIIDTEGIIRYLKPGPFMNVGEMEAFADAARTFSNK